MVSMLWNVSAKDLAARPVRVLLFVLAIALGVALMTATRIATESVIRSFNAQLEKASGKTDLYITFGTGEAGFPEDVVERVRAEGYVEHAAAIVRGYAHFTQGLEETLELFGLDVLQYDVTDLYDVEILRRTADDFTIINDPHGIFLTDTLARERSLDVGDKLPLATVTGVEEYTVRGVLAAHGLADAYGGRLAVMYLPAAQAVLGKSEGPFVSNVDEIDVALRPGVSVDQARERLQGILPEGLLVSEPAQKRLANRRTVAGLKATLLGISVFALLAAMFIVYSTTASLVGYRTPTMGTLITVGAEPAMLVRLILCEAAILGLIGAEIGVLLGTAMAHFAMEDVAIGLSLNYSLDFQTTAPLLNPFELTVVLPLAGVAAAVASAYVPARRLGRLDPLALKRVGVTGEGEDGALRGLLAFAAALALAGITILGLGVRFQLSRLCSLGTTLTVVASILAALPPARAVWRQLREPMRRFLGMAGWLAIEQINRSIERTIVTVAAIALSIAVALAASTLPRSFRSSIATWYVFRGDAIVSSRTTQGGWLSRPVSGSFEDSIARTPGVAGVETLRILQGQHYRGDRLAVAAMSDGFVRRAVDTAVSVVNGDRAEAARAIGSGRGLAVSENLRSHYAIDVGDELRLAAATGPVALPVVAVIPDYVSDKGSILVGRDLFRRRWHDTLVNYYSVDLQQGSDVDAFRGAFAHEAGKDSRALSVLATATLVGRIEDVIHEAFADVDALQLLVIAITLAGIVDLLVSNVLDRRRHYAMLRIVGALDTTVIGSIVIEAALVGLSAGVIGVVMGTAFSWIWVRFTYPVLVGYVLGLDFAWSNALLCALAATGTAMLAGAVSGYVGLRQPVMAAVRAE